MKLTGVPSAPVWINGKAVRRSSDLRADLAAGVHTIMVRLDAKNLPAHLRLETSEGTFLVD